MLLIKNVASFVLKNLFAKMHSTCAIDSFIVFILSSLIRNIKEAHLNSKWCNVLSLVNVVVQAGGQGEEAVGGDEQLRHQVSVERK